MNEVMKWRVIELCRRLWKVPILGWAASRLESHLYYQLQQAGWRPVDFRAGYRVPDDRLKIWKTKSDPRLNGIAKNAGAADWSNPPTSRKGGIGVDS